MRPSSRLTSVRGNSLPGQQAITGGGLPASSTSGKTSYNLADSFTTSTDLPTSTTEVLALNVDQETEDFVDGLKHGNPNILVTVRVRPAQPRELHSGSKDIVRVLSSKVVLLLDPGLCSQDDVLRVKRTREKRYAFDYVFDASKDQQCVYTNTTEFLVDGVLRGFNATAFAYGATGAGKTYTMIGTYDEPGVMVRTLRDLFTKVEQQMIDNEFAIRCSFLEIYNENVRDLLDSHNEHCEVREDPSRGMAISNVCEVDVKTADEILDLLQKGNKRRIQEPTDANQASSRSHAVVQVTVIRKERTPAITAELTVGKLSMVDLAGSERASQNNNRGMRMIEGASINRSLLALGNVINALSDKRKMTKNTFVPYRDSKLTRLLKDSLGGTCRTVMIANISPAHTQFEDTNNTLKYANRAKNIKTFSKRNVLSVNYHLEKYTHVIEQLQAEVGTLRAMIASGSQAALSQDLAATAESSRVAGIVKILHERQQLRQALSRLDEQLHQLEQGSPANLEKVPLGVSFQAQSLRKAKEDLVTRLRRNAAEYEELQRNLSLAPNSPGLLEELVRNMGILLEQNYQLQQTNAELNDKLVKNGQGQCDALRRRAPRADGGAESQQTTSSSAPPSSPEPLGCCVDRQMQKGQSQQCMSLCLEENTTCADPALGGAERRQLPGDSAASAGKHSYGQPPLLTTIDLSQQACPAVEKDTGHSSILSCTMPSSPPNDDSNDCPLQQRRDSTRSTNQLTGLDPLVQVTTCCQRIRSPFKQYKNGQSPASSSMHVSGVCSPARSNSVSPPQDGQFYTPRSQPLALPSWTAPCTRSLTDAVPHAALWTGKTSMAVDSAENDSPRCSTPNSSPCQPIEMRGYARVRAASTPEQLLKSCVAQPASEGQAQRWLQPSLVRSPKVQTQDVGNVQRNCSAAPVRCQLQLRSLSGRTASEPGHAILCASHYDAEMNSQFRRACARKVSTAVRTSQKSPFRSFVEEADVPDELGPVTVDEPVHTANPTFGTNACDGYTACSGSSAQGRNLSPVRKSAQPSGTMSPGPCKKNSVERAANQSNRAISRLLPTAHTTASLKNLSAQHQMDTACRYNGRAGAGEVQTATDESSYGLQVEAEGLRARTRAHFGFRCPDAYEELSI